MSLMPGTEHVTCLDDHYLSGYFLLCETIDSLREPVDEVLIHAAINVLKAAAFRNGAVAFAEEGRQKRAICTPRAVNDFLHIKVKDFGSKCTVVIHLHIMPCVER
ncbi:hypothetical protein DCC26_01525 [Auritidibacter sp. NML120779]|nr:hypothetical protein DCC26_01525 [Auritidibacter sp. NML120779]